jgi:hypothetical protein
VTNDDLSKELWKIANIVTGFAVFQTVAFTYACAKTEFSEMINMRTIKIAITIIILFASTLECLFVWWCTRQQVSLLTEVNHSKETENINNNITRKIIQRLGWGRMICIIFLLVPFLVSLYAPQLGGRPYKIKILPNKAISADAKSRADE